MLSEKFVVAATSVAVLAATALMVVATACSSTHCIYALEYPQKFNRPHANQLHAISKVGRWTLPIAVSCIATAGKIGIASKKPPQAFAAVPASYLALALGVSTACLATATHTTIHDNANVVTDVYSHSAPTVALAIVSGSAALAALAATVHLRTRHL